MSADLSEALSRCVLGRVGQGARVAVLAHAPSLERALRAAGCTVLAIAPAGPTLPAALRDFGPTHVVLPVPASARELEALLARVLDAAPRAELLLWFRHEGASARLLAALVGQPVEPALCDAEVVRGFQARGLRVAQREALAGRRRVTSLAEDTEAALHALLAQVSPASGGEYLFYALAPEAQAPRAAPDTPAEGLLSVILLADGVAPERLEETLLSLAGQDYAPLEVLLATRVPARDVEGLLSRYQRLGGFSFQLVPGADAPGEALRLARGRYVAFLSPDVVVYPDHYVQLIGALQAGSAAWAVARARHAFATPAPSGPEYIEGKRPFPLGEWLELAHLRDEPDLLHALVLDRERLGPFPLTSEPLSTLPLRLGAVFPPRFLAGLASCEVRTPTGQSPRAPAPWPELQVLVPLRALEERVVRARQAGESAKEFRHRVVDAVNTRLREGLPWLHGTLRRLASRRS